MAEGDLRREIKERFGDFLATHGFRETFYRYDSRIFGNEVLCFESGDLRIRFTRDRGQIWTELKGAEGEFTPIHVFLRALGIDEPVEPSDSLPGPGFLFGAGYLVSEWPRLVHFVMPIASN